MSDEAPRWRARGPGQPPRWWPSGEPWPPSDLGARRWRRRRARFMRRAAAIFALVLMLSLVGASTIVSRLTRGATSGDGFGVTQLVVLALLAVWAVAFLAATRAVGSPIGDLVGAAGRVAEGDFKVRVAPKGPSTLRAIAAAFNGMAERLQQQERQRRDLMADIAHELRTPLSIVQGKLEGILDGVYPADRSQIEPLLEDARVLARLVEDLRTLANAESGVLALDLERTDVGMLVRDAAAGMRDEAARRPVTIAVDDDPGVAPADVDPVRIRQVVLNLLANAVRHSPDGGVVSVRVRGTSARKLTIAVADTGAGIAPEELAKIFDRFYKGKDSTGSGLGLTIARSLVRAHGGEIVAASAPGAGTTITVGLPLSAV